MCPEGNWPGSQVPEMARLSPWGWGGGGQTSYTLSGLRIGGTTAEASDTYVAHLSACCSHTLTPSPERAMCLPTISLPWSPGSSLGLERPQKLSSPYPPQLASYTKLSSLKPQFCNLTNGSLPSFSAHLARGHGLHSSKPMGAIVREEMELDI